MPTDNCRYQLKNQRHSSHNQVFIALKGAVASTRILELGIASGYMGKYLSQCRYDMTGVEKDPFLARQAMPYYREVLTLDLNKEGIPPLKPFDFIILADILEHLYDPYKVLRQLHNLLNVGGKIIVCIPNTANWLIRFKLLFGNFDYTDRGIMDKDHTKLYTLKTARKLIQKAGFEIINFSPVSMPFCLVLKYNFLSDRANEVYYGFARLFPAFFAYQFVFTAVKSKKAAIP